VQETMKAGSSATPISSLVEAELRDSSGALLGMVDELLIDLHSGRIEYVLAVGMRGQRLQFPWRSISLKHGSFWLNRSGPRLVTGGESDDERT
jgi:sporulation protein YlmC with PRC-barrel domain